MPCFNVEKYIERSFKSILNQTMDLEDIEVIMVDDCSTDNTKNIIKEYEKKYLNFKAVFHEKNSGGCGIPRNSGLKIANGKYIMFLDPDDEYALDMCEVMYNKIEETGVDLVRCNHERITPSFSRLVYMLDKDIDEIKINCKTDLPPGCAVWNVIHRKSFLDEKNIIFSDLKSMEDILFTTTEHVNTDYIVCLNNYHGYKYYFYEKSTLSSRPTKDNLDAVLSSFNLTKKLLESRNRPDIIKHIFSKISVSFFMRLLNCNTHKKLYLKKFYEFEKSLSVDLNMNYTWAEILNKMIMNKQFTLAVLYMDTLKYIRVSPLNKFYQKLLK